MQRGREAVLCSLLITLIDVCFPLQMQKTTMWTKGFWVMLKKRRKI